MAPTTHKILVVGSTGATGKHVVQMLLDRGDTEVIAVARSKDKLMGLMRNGKEQSVQNLTVKEAGISKLTGDELKVLTEGCTAVVSCLGHNLTFKGMFREGYWVSETVKKLTQAMPEGCRFVLMSTDGLAYPDGSDPKRTRFESGMLRFMRWLLPPVADNEMAVGHLFDQAAKENSFEWVAVRPGDLFDIQDEEVVRATSKRDYDVFDHTFGGLFGDNSTARSQVAHFLVDLSTMSKRPFQKKYNHKLPVIYKYKDPTSVTIVNDDEPLILSHE